MSNDALLVVKCLFQTIWRLFTSWLIPGTDVTPAAFFFFLAAAGIGLTFVTRFLGVGGGVSVSGGANAGRFVYDNTGPSSRRIGAEFKQHRFYG